MGKSEVGLHVRGRYYNSWSNLHLPVRNVPICWTSPGGPCQISSAELNAGLFEIPTAVLLLIIVVCKGMHNAPIGAVARYTSECLTYSLITSDNLVLGSSHHVLDSWDTGCYCRQIDSQTRKHQHAMNDDDWFGTNSTSWRAWSTVGAWNVCSFLGRV